MNLFAHLNLCIKKKENSIFSSSLRLLDVFPQWMMERQGVTYSMHVLSLHLICIYLCLLIIHILLFALCKHT